MERTCDSFSESIQVLIDTAANKAAERALQLYEQAHPEPPERLLNSTELCKFLGIAYGTKERLEKKGIIKPISFAGRRRYDPVQIMKDLEKIQSAKYSRDNDK